MARASRTVLVSAALLLISAIHVRAQVALEVHLHGAPLIGSLYGELLTLGGHRFENLSTAINVSDVETGERIYTIAHPDRGFLVLHGTLMRPTAASASLRNRIRLEVDRFNDSAPVGTMYYDESRGEVTIAHHLNPDKCSIPLLAAVSDRFGSMVRSQRARLSMLEPM